jgi:Fur family transcriptional regulator, ferric uptake regulator
MIVKQYHQQAEAMIRSTGSRVTAQRIEVLATLLAAERALTHQELEQRVDRGREIDRVTIYRVLEWLTGQDLAHRIAGDDRIWRFNAAGHAHEGDHAHFQCNVCSTVFCLEGLSTASPVRLPRGFRTQQVELTVRGLCANCTPPVVQKRS